MDLETTLQIREKLTLADWLIRHDARPDHHPDRESKLRRVPVLEALAHFPRLVLLGLPGAVSPS